MPEKHTHTQSLLDDCHLQVAVSASAAKPTKRWESDGPENCFGFDLWISGCQFLWFFQKNFENSRTFGCLEGLVELIISEKWGAHYCNSIRFKRFQHFTMTETAANCRLMWLTLCWLVWPTLCFLRRPSQAQFGGRMTGSFCLLLVPVSEDWHVQEGMNLYRHEKDSDTVKSASKWGLQERDDFRL